MKKEITFVYICKAGENEELRYSIRSVIKHFPSAKIWVVGEPPHWYDGDYIKVKQNESKYANAFKNLYAILASDKIPKEFVLMNDDFFIIKEFDPKQYWYEESIEEKHGKYFDAYERSSYTRRLSETKHRLHKMGYTNAKSYELHVPFYVEKWKLARAIKNESLLWRSMYGNMFEVGGEYMEDVKVYATVKMNFKNHNYKKSKSAFLSSDDVAFETVLKDYLAKKFPKATKYEK